MPDRPATPTTGDLSGVESPTLDGERRDSAPHRTAAATDLAARLQDLENQLEALGHELRTGESGEPPPSQARGRARGSHWERRLDDLAQRIHGLAGEQKRLRTHFSQLLDRFEALTPNPGVSNRRVSSLGGSSLGGSSLGGSSLDGPSLDGPSLDGPAPTPGASTPAGSAELDERPLPQRLLALGKTLARKLRPAHPQRLVTLEPVVGTAADRLPTLGVVLPSPDEIGSEGVSRIFGSQTQPPDAVLRVSPSGGFELEAGSRPPELVLRPVVPHSGAAGTRPLPRGLCELLRLLFASEDLDFAEVELGEAQRWLCERPGGPRGRSLGKVLTWDGDATSAVPLSTHDRLGVGTYRHLGSVLPRRHTLRPLDSVVSEDSGAQTEGAARGGLWLRLGSLLGGGDQLVATLAQVAECPLRVALDEPSDPLGVERRRRLELRFPSLAIFPLGDVLATSLRTSAHRPIANRQGVTRSIEVAPWATHAPHLMSSEGPVSSGPPAPALPALPLPVEPNTGWPWWVLGSEPGDRPPSTGRRLRQWLGIPEDHLLVVHSGDLIPHHRPEDFVTLARHLVDLPQCHFLMVGRGPLAGPVDDLARYAAHPRWRRLDSLDEAEMWAAADLACSVAPTGANLPALLSALAAGRPVVARDRTLSALVEGSAGLVASGVDALAETLRGLADDPDRRAELARGAGALAAPFGPSRARAAWRRAIDPTTRD